MNFNLLDHYEEEKNYEEVIKLIDEMILNNPQDISSLLFRKADALIELEKYSQAITTLQVILKDASDKEKIRAYLLLSRCYLHMDDEKNHVKYLYKVLELDENNEIILKQLSYTAYINEEFKTCYDYVKKLIEIEKADFEDYTNLIFCCIQLDMIDEALEYAEKLIKIDPTNLDIFATLTILYESLEDDKKLNEICNKIIDLKDDGTLQIILLKAQASLELGYKKEAFNFVNKAIKLNPYDPFPYLMKGILYNKLDMADEADECFNEAFQLNPEILSSMLRLSQK